MENINIKNGIPINKTKTYCMYHMYFPDTTEFFMCIPSKSYELYKIIIDITDIDFDEKDIDIDDIVAGKLSDKADSAYDEYPNCIYIIPKITAKELNDALEENDDRLYKRLLKKIEQHRNNAYWSLANAAIFEDAIHVESQINILKQSDEDIKLFWWLDLKNIKGYKQIELHQRIVLPKEKTKKIIEAEKELKQEAELEELNKKAELKLKKVEEEEKNKKIELKLAKAKKEIEEELIKEELNKKAELKLKKEENEMLNKKAEEKLQKINKINAIKEEMKKIKEEEASRTYREITNVIVFEPPKDIPKNKRKRIPTGDGIHSTGYSNLAFILTVLVVSLVMGIGLAYLILR